MFLNYKKVWRLSLLLGNSKMVKNHTFTRVPMQQRWLDHSKKGEKENQLLSIQTSVEDMDTYGQESVSHQRWNICQRGGHSPQPKMSPLVRHIRMIQSQPEEISDMEEGRIVVLAPQHNDDMDIRDQPELSLPPTNHIPCPNDPATVNWCNYFQQVLEDLRIDCTKNVWPHSETSPRNFGIEG